MKMLKTESCPLSEADLGSVATIAGIVSSISDGDLKSRFVEVYHVLLYTKSQLLAERAKNQLLEEELEDFYSQIC